MSTVDLRELDTRDRWINVLSMTVVAALAFLLYRRALSFAFFNDDPTGHFAWMATRSFTDFFTSSADYGYYRPVVFATLQSLVALVGYNPLPFHALLIALHAANVALLWLLARRLGGSRPYAWAAALFFAAAPFSYEAVAYVASLTHPLMLFWLLLTLLLYQNARTDGRRGWRWFYGLAAYAALVACLLTHENGLLAVPALIGVEWLARPPRGLVEGLKRPFLPYFVAPALYLLLWLSIPKTSDQGLAGFSEWLSNLVPFVQTLVYPLLPLVSLSAQQTTALALLAMLALAVLFAAARIAQRVPLWLFGLGWFIFSALPATLFLQPDYLYGSPRLHYLPSVGVALLWALPLPALLATDRQRWARVATAALGAAYVLAIALPPLSFVRCELDFYAESSRIVRQMAAVATEAPPGELLTLVNVPFFFSSYATHPQGCANPYPWTPIGTVVMPPYAAARDFVRFNGGPDRAVTAVTAPAYAPGWRTAGDSISIADLRERTGGGAVYLYDLGEGGFRNLAGLWRPDQPGAQSLAVFASGLDLVEGSVNGLEDSIAVDLLWQVRAETAEPVTVFVHLYDESGSLVAQHDAPPTGGGVPPALWAAGDLLADRHILALPADLPAGDYLVGVGQYDPATAERYRAQAAGVDLAENLFVLERVSRP